MLSRQVQSHSSLLRSVSSMRTIVLVTSHFCMLSGRFGGWMLQVLFCVSLARSTECEWSLESAFFPPVYRHHPGFSRMIAHKHPTMQTMTSAWLLPVISLIVTSSGGAVLSSSLYRYSLNHALLTATFSIYLVSIGLSVNLMILTVYLLRLIVRGLPSGTGIYSVFLPLGPTGRAGYTILLLGQFFRAVLPLPYGSSELLTAVTTGESVSVMCTTVALALWSLESMWLFFAILGMYTVLRQTRVPFKLEIWGIIFPNVSVCLIVLFDT